MKISIMSVLTLAGMVLTTAGLSAQQQSGESPVLDAASRALAVESVASVVERNYPWPDTARMIAAHVRGRQASNDYDTFSTFRDLANALTRDLRAINGDRHLGVSVGSPMGSPGPSTGSPAAPATGIDRFERLDGNVGYLKFNLFAGNSAFDAVAQALAALDGTDAMILDVRAVPGGTTQMSQFVISHFMPPEVHYLTILSMATGETTNVLTLSEVPGPRRLDVPLYILVDGRSGSAAESAPFVLQHFGRATVVGERTAGAGRNVVQFPAEFGLRVSLSTTRVYEPSSGREWERSGVLPDIATTSEDALTAALEHAREIIRVTAVEPVEALQQASTVARITVEEARTAVDAAEAEARINGWNLVFVISDAEGTPIYLRRMDGASKRNYDVAMNKISTSITAGMHTADYAAALQAGTIEPIAGALTFDGGLLLRRDGQVVGAFSASGASGSQDAQAVRAGMMAIGIQPAERIADGAAAEVAAAAEAAVRVPVAGAVRGRVREVRGVGVQLESVMGEAGVVLSQGAQEFPGRRRPSPE